ncbi:MAG: lysophospholipid acyltransferase family protein [Polyangiales bacterium]
MSDGSLSLGFLAAVGTLRTSASIVADSVLGKLTREAVDRRIATWSGRLVREAAIELEIQGQEHLPTTDETFVVMSNHQSDFDIPVLYQAFPRCMRMLAKTELYRIPVFGRAVRAAEFIEVDRKNRQRALQSIELAKERLKSGIHIWVAPEGTRSASGKLGPFKKGGFVLALDTGARILPITLDGTRSVLPPHSFRVHPHQRVTVRFHAPIDAASYGHERRDELVAHVRSVIASALPEELHG